MRAIVLTSVAQVQFRAARDWYEAIRPGLGGQFTNTLDQALSIVRRHPAQFKIAMNQYRRALVKRFPYELFFEFNDEQIIVYSVFHTSQNPTRWVSLLNESLTQK